jgi:hypothetical protein
MRVVRFSSPRPLVQLLLTLAALVVASGCTDTRPQPTPPVASPAPPVASPTPAAAPTSSAKIFTFPDESFRAISGFDDSDIWATGTRVSTSGVVWVIRHWDGARWSQVPASGTAAAAAVWARAADDAWAVGANGVALHWDGTSWLATDTSNFRAPATGETSLASVWSAAANDVWAVGYIYPSSAGPGLIVHYNGTAWTRFVVDLPDGLFKVWGTASNDVWAGGSSGIVVHWDGKVWTRVDGGTSLYRFGIWGAASNDVWAVGNGGAVTRFDGNTWSPFFTEGYTEYAAISGASTSNAWAVGKFTGFAGTPRAGYTGRLIGHWNGSQWSRCKTAGLSALSDVWVSKTAKVWVAGGSLEEISETARAHCDGP